MYLRHDSEQILSFSFREFVRLPILIDFFNAKVTTIIDYISSHVRQPSRVEINVSQPLTIQCSHTEAIDVSVLNVNVGK